MLLKQVASSLRQKWFEAPLSALAVHKIRVFWGGLTVDENI